MTALAELLRRPDLADLPVLRAAVASDLAALAALAPLPVVGPAAVGEESRRALRETPSELHLWANAGDRPADATRLATARTAMAAKAVWGRAFVLHASRAGLTPFVREVHAATGVLARVAPSPCTMLLIGSDVGVVTDPSRPVSYRVTDPELLADLRALFVRLWATSEPADGDPAGGDVLWLVRLLTSGLTDQAAAARMRTSLRTYRRRVADLMDTLGATNRFAAGVEADRRGLVALAEALADRAAPEAGAVS